MTTKIQTKTAVKLHNRNVVLNVLRSSEQITIPVIVKKTRLSNNTVIKVIDFYIEEGLILNAGKGESTYDGGKKPNLYIFNPEAKFAIGMHFAHDGKLLGVLTDLNGTIIAEVNFKMPWNISIDEVIQTIYSGYLALLDKSKIDSKKIIGVAIGTHGITDFKSGRIIKSPHNPVWGENIELRSLVEELIDRPVYVDNQIRFKVYAEKIYGIGFGYKNIIVLHGGVSAIMGVISDNTIKRGNNNLLGSIGHMTLDPRDEEICMCGGKGCFGVLIDKKRVLRRALERIKTSPDSIIFKNTKPENIKIENIFEASNNSDPLAMELMDEVIKWFCLGIHNIVLFYDPEIIIIQGKYSEAGDYFINSLQKRISEVSLLGIPMAVKIEYSTLNSKAGDIGAAAFVIEEFFKIPRS